MENFLDNEKFEYKHKSSKKNNFRFKEVLGSLEIQEDSKPFKKLKFGDTDEQEDIEKVSDMISEFSLSFEEPKEKRLKIHASNFFELKPRYLDPKFSPRSKNSEKFSTIYTPSSRSSKVPDDQVERPGSTKITQQNEEKENFPSRSKEYLEFLPGKKFCKKCKIEVNTTIKMEMPTMPL
jgi:hypothetical protein